MKFEFYKMHMKNIFFGFLQAHLMPLIAAILVGIYLVHPKKISGLKFLMKSHRFFPFGFSTNLIKRNLHLIRDNAVELFDGRDSASEDIQRTRGLVVKKPYFDESGRCIEKGVYIITFTGTLQFYIEKINVDKLQDHYFIVLEPSWAGYCLSEILWWTGRKGPVFIQATEKRDFIFIKELESNLVPMSFGASDWVNPDIFFPIKDCEKTYDFIYVSNHNPIKRNYVFLRALSKLKNMKFKAALACSGWGENRDYDYELIKHYGLEDKVDTYEGLPQSELNLLLNKSKVNVLLSLKEGSNRSIFEGFFANTPAILLDKNIGVNKSYINQNTGSICAERNLPETLIWHRENWKLFSPHDWAMANISIYKTSEKLTEILIQYSQKLGFLWRHPIALKVNSPEATLYESNGEIIPNSQILESYRL
jgi:glycosyltransferase involved in cell wall biosynthesis